MTRRFLALASLLLLTFVFSGCSLFRKDAAPDPLSHIVFEPGTTHRYALVLDQKDNRVIFGKANPIETLQEFETSWRVREVAENGNAVIDVAVEAYKLSRQMPDGSVVTFDSYTDTIPESGLVAGFAAISGGRVSLTVSPRREIIGIEGAESLLASMLEALGGDTVANQPISDTIKEYYSAPTFTALLATVLPPAPPKGIAGDWVGRRVVASSYSVVSEEAYNTAETENGEPVIEALGALVSDFSVKKGSTREEKVNYELLGQTEGRFVLDPESGWLKSATFTGSGDGQLVFIGDFDSTNFPAMPTQINVSITAERLDATPQ
ncbi:MAG: hypothetical protein PWP23_1966 [Candidatus Sumerlaeota bacterium]|nr:hypothetical protein [Candidatus Sumerlaeota bacterium]